jgi:nicotinamide-nucleotide amidase
MNAAILTIGTEILIGQVIDTNSAWMANELNQIGVSIQTIISISDSGDEIKSTVEQLLNKYDLVLVTGGLGPTSDDITTQILCEVFNSKLVFHELTLQHIESIFAKRNLPLTELNRNQALVPECCEVLFNSNGTAPGMWFTKNCSILVAMPGVPFEMKGIMEQYVIPKLAALRKDSVIVHKTIQTFGLPESFLAQKLEEWERDMPSSISIAYLPSPISIRVRLSSVGTNKVEIEKAIDQQVQKLLTIIPNYVFGFDDDSLASAVGVLLNKYGKSLSLAESCTGGTISQLITQISGSSAYYKGGVVAYSNEIKVNFLNVDNALIIEHGAVSQQVVEAMANGVRAKFKTDYSIATSGIAGPTGATPGKPVGLVWIAVSTPEGTISKSFAFSNDRERNILRSSVTALNMLRLELVILTK